MRVEEIAYRVRGRFPAAFARLQKLIEVALHLGLRRARSRAASDSRVEFVTNGQRACLRMLGVADADLLVALMESASEHELEFFRPHAFDEAGVRRVLKLAAYWPYGLFLDDRLIGYALIKFTPARTGFIGRYIAAEFVGRGFGKAMVRYMYWQFAKAGVKPMATVHRRNYPSLRSHRESRAEIVQELNNGYLLIRYRLFSEDRIAPAPDELASYIAERPAERVKVRGDRHA